MPSGSKDRITAVSSDILARRGYHGMGLKALSAAAELPYGSIYHHFPGGKEEIAAAAVAGVGDVVAGLLDTLFAERPPEEAVGLMFDFMAGRLADADFATGCPVGTPALDGSADSAALRAACDRALRQMVAAIATGLARAGAAPDTAGDVAVTVVAAYEGATLLARVERSDAPLRAAARAMAGLVGAATGITAG
ncbi:MAG TPA: TetR/AcrR family transcriptional regulator [Acidimicrobiales bacterium]|nr:TetR/AcrR family transcriptional regulator [Acidimicrobiales bacterium]